MTVPHGHHTVNDERQTLAASAEAAGLGLWEYRPAAGEVRTRWRGPDLAGVGPEPVRIDAFLDRIHAADRDRVKARIDAACASADTALSVRFRVVTRGARERVLELAGQPLGQGDERVLQCFVRDVTAEETAERRVDDLTRRMSQQVQELETVLGVAPVGVLVAHDRDCTRLTANRMARRMLRVGPGEDIAPLGDPGRERTRPYHLQRDGQRVPVQDLPTVRAARHDIRLDGEEYRVHWETGEPPADILVFAEPLHASDGAVSGCVTAFIDITARKQAEERLRDLNDRLEHYLVTRTRSLEESRSRLRALARELAMAEEQERRRIATEIHDYLAQMLVGAKMKLHTLGREDAARRAGEIGREISGILDDALNYSRTLVAELSPSLLLEKGVRPAVGWLVDEFSKRHGLKISLSPGQDDYLLDEQRTALAFRAVRELLMNVRKHAPGAQVRVVLEDDGRDLWVRVEDDGPGFDARTAHQTAGAEPKFGLFSLGEMVHSVGGTFELRSSPGAGTTARIRLPLETTPAESADDAPIRAEQTDELPAARQIHQPATKRVMLSGGTPAYRQRLTQALAVYDDVTLETEVTQPGMLGEQAGGTHPDALIIIATASDVPETIRRLKRSNAHIHIVVLYDASSGEESRFTEAGAAAALPMTAAVEEVYCAISEGCALHDE